MIDLILRSVFSYSSQVACFLFLSSSFLVGISWKELTSSEHAFQLKILHRQPHSIVSESKLWSERRAERRSCCRRLRSLASLELLTEAFLLFSSINFGCGDCMMKNGTFKMHVRLQMRFQCSVLQHRQVCAGLFVARLVIVRRLPRKRRSSRVSILQAHQPLQGVTQ